MSAAEYTSLSRASRADIYEYIDMHEVISSVHSYCLFTGWDLVTAGAIDEESFDDPYPRKTIHHIRDVEASDN